MARRRVGANPWKQPPFVGMEYTRYITFLSLKKVALKKALITMRNYESIKGDAILKRRARDQNEWELGDLFVEAEDLAASYVPKLAVEGQEPGNPAPQNRHQELTEEEAQFSKGRREILSRLAEDIGLARKAVYIRANISRRVAKDSELGWIRASTLTYSTMRELYAIESDEELNKVAKKAISQNMTIREVRTELEGYRDKKAVDAGRYKCQHCKDTITNTKELVAIGHTEHRDIFCSSNCARLFIANKAAFLLAEEQLILEDQKAVVNALMDEWESKDK